MVDGFSPHLSEGLGAAGVGMEVENAAVSVFGLEGLPVMLPEIVEAFGIAGENAAGMAGGIVFQQLPDFRKVALEAFQPFFQVERTVVGIRTVPQRLVNDDEGLGIAFQQRVNDDLQVLPVLRGSYGRAVGPFYRAIVRAQHDGEHQRGPIFVFELVGGGGHLVEERVRLRQEIDRRATAHALVGVAHGPDKRLFSQVNGSPHRRSLAHGILQSRPVSNAVADKHDIQILVLLRPRLLESAAGKESYGNRR